MLKNLQWCKACPLRENCRAPSPGFGCRDASVVHILENAGLATGASLAYYEKMLRSVTPSYKDSVYTTFLFKCPTGGATPTVKDRDACKKWLWEEIKTLRPKVVFTFGVRPTALLLRTNPSKIILEQGVGVAHPADHLPGCEIGIVPMYSLAKLTRGSLAYTQQAIEYMEKFIV